MASKSTRARRVILAAAAEKGLTVTEMEWAPWQAASEMEGIGGGWTVEFVDSDGAARGLSAEETADYIRRYCAPKETP